MYITHQTSLFNMSSVASSPIAAAAKTIKKCISLTRKGVQCTNKSILDDRCKSHYTIYKQDNPSASEILTPCKTRNALCAIGILNKCRIEKQKAEYAFMIMYAVRNIYDGSLNSNRFITGGCAESSFCLLLKNNGIDCTNVALTSTIIDLIAKDDICIDHEVANTNLDVQEEENDGTTESESTAPAGTMINHTLEISVKTSASIENSPVLENYRGKKRQEIRKLGPTVIIYVEVNRFRIVYLDHDIIKQAYPDLDENEFNLKVYKNSDSNLSFNPKFLRSFIPRLPSEYILNVNIPNQETLQFEQKNINDAAMMEAKRQLSMNNVNEPVN